MSEDENPFSAWVGSTEVRQDIITLSPALGVNAMLDREGPAPDIGDPLPPLWHWFYFLPQVSASQIGPDGHPERGGFLPPVDLPRRMFAGARLTFHTPLIIGQPAIREGEVLSITEKSGKSGRLAFVTVRYLIKQMDGTVCIEEEQDIVYREPGDPVPRPEPLDAMPDLAPDVWSSTVVPDEVLLFRFSALTFNAHRIHYDHPYAINEEGYPGLVVHGPLTALLLAELTGRHAGKPMGSFTFRGRAPLFDLDAFRVVGTPDEMSVELEALGPDGNTAMTASAKLIG